MNDVMIARKPMREKLIAQKDVAVMKAAIRPAMRLRKSSPASRYMPSTVKVPKTIDQSLRAGMVLPKVLSARACRLMKSPSRP